MVSKQNISHVLFLKCLQNEIQLKHSWNFKQLAAQNTKRSGSELLSIQMFTCWDVLINKVMLFFWNFSFRYQLFRSRSSGLNCFCGHSSWNVKITLFNSQNKRKHVDLYIIFTSHLSGGGNTDLSSYRNQIVKLSFSQKTCQPWPGFMTFPEGKCCDKRPVLGSWPFPRCCEFGPREDLIRVHTQRKHPYIVHCRAGKGQKGAMKMSKGLEQVSYEEKSQLFGTFKFIRFV